MEMSELQIELQALFDRGLTVADAVTVLGNQPVRRSHQELVEAARDLYQSDEIQIDDNAIISECDSDYEQFDGVGRIWSHAWVQAWVRVPDYELECCLAEPQAFSITEAEAELLLE
jgi:hypothetical protein